MKNRYDRIKDYQLLFNDLKKQYGLALSDEIKIKVNNRYSEMEDLLGNVPKEERKHVTLILERAALYTVLKERFPDSAYEWVNGCLRSKNASAHKMFAVMTKSKMGARFFMKMWDKVTESGLGDQAGFKKKWLIRESNISAFDMIECPYVRYLSLLGCPELTRSFCDSDVDVYGNLPNIDFQRTQTLGTGGCKCDFHVELSL